MPDKPKNQPNENMKQCHFCQKPLEDSAQECLYCGEILSTKLFSDKTFSSESEIDTKIDADIERRLGSDDIVFNGNHGIFFKKPLRITKKEITSGKKILIHKNITEISHHIFHPMPNNTFYVQANIYLSDGKKEIKIRINRNNNPTCLLSDDLIGALYVLVERRILYKMVLAFDLGGDIDICGFKLNRGGISYARPYCEVSHIQWSDYHGMKYDSEKVVSMLAKGLNNTIRTIGKFDLLWPNSGCILELMPVFYNKMVPRTEAEARRV